MALEIWYCGLEWKHEPHVWYKPRTGISANDPRLGPWKVQCFGEDPDDYRESPYAQEMQRRREYTEDGLDAIDSHKPMAKVIWEASRADEGTISATGADVVAKALIMAGYGKLGQEQPSCDQCGGAYARDRWPGNQYDGHWDTCPNRPCGMKAVGGYCIMPRGHNMGRADVPDNHMSRKQADALEAPLRMETFVDARGAKAVPGRIMEVPDTTLKTIVQKTNPSLFFVCILKGHDWFPFLRWSWDRGRWHFNGEHCRRCDARRPVNLHRIEQYRQVIMPWLNGRTL